MKKIILVNLLFGSLLLAPTVYSEDATTISREEDSSLEVEYDEEESYVIGEENQEFDTNLDLNELKAQYEVDIRNEQLSFEEYVRFQEYLLMSAEAPRSYSFRASQPTVRNDLIGERKEVVDEAFKHIGKPYTQDAGRRLGAAAFDCSGLTNYVFKKVTKKDIGTWTVPQEKSGKVIAIKDAKPGDLFFWGNRGNTYHVAIYIGNNEYIHAPTFGQTVSTSKIWWNEFAPSFALRMDLKEKNPVDLSNFYTVAPGKTVALRDITLYSSPEFNNSTKIRTIKKDTVMTGSEVVYSKSGVPRLKHTSGYFTASKSNVVKRVSNSSDFYIAAPGKTVTLRDITLYSSPEFNSSTKIKTIKKGTVMTGNKVVYSRSGVPRLQHPSGYFTASKSNVVKRVANINDFYTVAPGRTKTLRDITLYSSPEFNNTTKIKTIKKGTVMTGTDVVYASNGVPRLVHQQGYFTAAKKNVAK